MDSIELILRFCTVLFFQVACFPSEEGPDPTVEALDDVEELEKRESGGPDEGDPRYPTSFITVVVKVS